jgi:hypothetical protein
MGGWPGMYATNSGVRLAQIAHGHAQHLGRPTWIDAGEVLAQRQLIAEQRGHGVRVGVASDVPQQRLIVDVAQRVAAEVQCRAQSHRHNTGAERRLQRLPHPQIGGNGKRRHQLRHVYSGVTCSRAYPPC